MGISKHKRVQENRCKWCGKVLPFKKGRGRKYCNDSHKTRYYEQLKNERLNRMSPEKFIKKELKGELETKPIPKKMLSTVIIQRVIPRSGTIIMSTRNTLIRKLGLKQGDVISLKLDVVYREPKQ